MSNLTCNLNQAKKALADASKELENMQKSVQAVQSLIVKIEELQEIMKESKNV